MSLWNNFKSSLGSGPANLTTTGTAPKINSAAQKFADIVKNGQITGQSINNTPSALAAASAINANPTNTYDAETIGKELEVPEYTAVTTLLDQYVYQPAYEATSFAALLANSDTFRKEDTFTESIKRAWQGRKDISLGQAISDIAAEKANMLPDWGALAEFNKVDIDIYNKELRDRVYARTYNEAGERVDANGVRIAEASWVEKAWRTMSGGIDVTKQLVVDPLVIGGKLAKAGRLSAFDKFRAASVVDNVSDFGKAQTEAAKATNYVNQLKLKLITDEPELQRVNTFIEEVAKGKVHPDSIVAEVDNMRIAEGLDPLKAGTPIDEYMKQYKNYQKTLDNKVTQARTTITDLNKVGAPKPQIASGVSDFVKQIVTRQMTWDEIAQHRTLREFSTDTEFLSKALELAAKKGEAAVADVLLLAQGSDPSALIRLRGQHRSLLTIIDNAQTKMDNVETKIQAALNAGDEVTRIKLQEQKNKFSELVKAMKEDDAYLDLLTRTEDSIIGSLPGMEFSSNVSVLGRELRISPVIENFRANRAIVKAGLVNGTIKARKGKIPAGAEFNWTRVQKSPLHNPTYVAQWVGHKIGLEKPSGLVTVAGLDMADGVKELRTVLDYATSLKMNPLLKKQFMDEFVSAKDSLSRQAVLDKVEKEMVRATAEKYGVLDIVEKTKDGKEVASWEIIYEKFLKERATAVENFKRDKVFAIDSNGTQIANPVLESQLAYSRPMLDGNELDNFFKNYATDKTVWRSILTTSSKIKDEWVMPSWVTVDRLWRADVLIRLGYPQRNLLSEWMVLSMYDRGLHGMFSTGTITEAAKNFASNRYAHFQDIGARFQAGIDMAQQTGASVTRAKIRGLTPARVDWAEYEKFASDNIAILKEQRIGIENLLNEITQDPYLAKYVNNPVDTLAKLDAQIALEESRLAKIAARVEAKGGDRFGKRKTVGQKTVVIRGNEFAGVFEGIQGKATMGLVSSGGRQAFDASPLNSAIKEMGLERSGSFRDIHPNEDAYFGTLADLVNNQFRGSTTASMILQNKTKQEVIEYLQSPKGKAELQRLGWDMDIMRASDKAKKTRLAGRPEETKITLGQDANGDLIQAKYKLNILDETTESNYYDFVRYQLIENYLPNEKMRQIVSQKFATDELGRGEKLVNSAELRLAAKDTKLNPIHGEHLENPADLTAAEKINSIVNDYFIKKLFRGLGEYVEDAGVSHPFANSVYNAKLDEITRVWEENGIIPSVDDKLLAQLQARKWAVKQSREYLYRVIRKNGIASAIPVLAPFFQAQYSTMRRVGKLAYRNPDQAARLVWAWNQINTHAQEDQDGNRWLTFRIPNSWYDDKGLSKLMPQALQNAIKSNNQPRWGVNSFNLLLAGFRIPSAEVLPGEEESVQDKVARWATAGQSIIGTGWTVQVLANELIKYSPAMDQEISDLLGVSLPARDIIEIFASPYPSDKWYDPILSGWNKRVQSLVVGEGNNDFERTKLLMFQNHLDRQRTGEEPMLDKNVLKNHELLWEQSTQEAAAFIALRLVANLSLAFIPSYEGPMTQYVELYRAYQVKYGVKAYDKWLEHYPDMGYIAISRSKNLAGSSQSTDAVYLRKEHNDMIEEAISSTGMSREDSLAFVQMITNGDIGASILRDPVAGYWQREKGDRIQLSAEQGFESQQAREGWAWFMGEKQMYNEALAEKGISRYSNSAANMNKLFRERVRDYATQNPEWYQQYSAMSGSKAANGFARAMQVALNDEKFVNSLSPDSFWFDIESIIEERDLLIEETINRGLASPTKEMQELYGRRIEIYLQNPTTRYYFDKFLDNDPFDEAQPGS